MQEGTRHISRRSWRALIAATVGVLGLAAASGPSYADPIPQGWTASNMQAVGYSDLQGRGGPFKLAIKKVGERWYLYMGHLWHYGFSILEVTDPKNPRYVKFVPMPTNNWTIQLTMSGNLMLTALERQIPAWGGDLSKPFSEGIMLWDISDIENPKQISHWKTGGRGTHRNQYPGGKYAFVPAGMPGYVGNILVILDVSDPLNPKEAGRWWQPGQKEGEPHDGGPRGFHGPANLSPDGRMLSMAYTPDVINLDITDPANPKVLSRVRMTPPFLAAGAGSQSLHGAMPIWNRNLVFANSEASASRCNEGLNWAGLFDIADPAKMRLVSLFPTPKPPPGLPYTNFCDKGGRFGPHNTNHEIHMPDVEKPGNLVYLTYFNAGLRVYSIKDPRQPEETGWFIPPQPPKRHGPQPPNELVTQTEDVLVDTRGFIYVNDKHWGIWVLRYTGPEKN